MNRFLGTIIEHIYYWCGNYGLAIILFTLLIKVILLPLGVKQQKSMAKIQKLQPIISDLQKKYKNDQERLNMELVKVYKDNNASPMGGCLPLLIQLPILFGLINVIYNPAKYILGMENVARIDGIKKAVEAGMNFDFLGIDLSVAPSAFGLPPKDVSDLIYWIIPILATVATYISGKISQKQQSATQGSSASAGNAENQAAQMSKSMTTMMPIMTLVFTYTMPGTAALYWFISTASQTIQQVLLNKFVKVDDIVVKKNGGKKK